MTTKHQLAVFVIGAALLAPSGHAQDTRPRGWGVFGGDSVALAVMHHCWMNPRGVTVCGTAFQPLDWLGIPELVVPSGGVVEVRFEQEPARLSVTQERYGTEGEVEVSAEGGVRVPNDADLYIFRVTAEWQNGNVTAAFRVRVVGRRGGTPQRLTNSLCSSPLRGLGPSGHPLCGHAACMRKRRALRRTSET